MANKAKRTEDSASPVGGGQAMEHLTPFDKATLFGGVPPHVPVAIIDMRVLHALVDELQPRSVNEEIQYLQNFLREARMEKVSMDVLYEHLEARCDAYRAMKEIQVYKELGDESVFNRFKGDTDGREC
jgi:hypothetical protein